MTIHKALSTAILLAATTGALADVKPASIFSDHMVLQRSMTVPVWGKADPGENVTVTIGGQKQTAVAGADGKWNVRLTELKPSDAAMEMVIAGKNSVTIKDVLIGEVWLGSGQSNMEFTVSKKVKSFAGVTNEDQEIAAANYPQIRMFTVKMRMTDAPQDDCEGRWQVCTPAEVPSFSAVGYFFSRELQKAIKAPIGFINTSYGASTAQAWINKPVLDEDPQYKGLMDGFAKTLADWDAGQAARAAAPATTQGAGARGPRNPHQDQHNPTLLWNAMLRPVQPYAIRGFLWYQGESITGSTAQYSALMETLITSWRKEWNQGDLPFYLVQLAGQDANSNRPEVREAQADALRLPNVGMAVTVDIGEKTNVHPRNKQDLGDRLARIARARDYAEKIEYCGPAYEGMKVEGDKIRVTFSHVGSGLVAKGGDLKWFSIAGKDGKFVDATANIEGQSVIVSAPGITEPAAVRYAWHRWPDGCNLYNTEGLPAAPFRSDKP